MRGPLPSVPLELPARLVQQAQLLAPTRHPLDAVCYVLEDYPRLIARVRDLSRRLEDLQDPELEDLLEDLKAIARRILDL